MKASPDIQPVGLSLITASLEEEKTGTPNQRRKERVRLWKEALGVANELIDTYGQEVRLDPDTYHERVTKPVKWSTEDQAPGARLRQIVITNHDTYYEDYKKTVTNLEMVDMQTDQTIGVGFGFTQAEIKHYGWSKTEKQPTQIKGYRNASATLEEIQVGHLAIGELRSILASTTPQSQPAQP